MKTGKYSKRLCKRKTGLYNKITTEKVIYKVEINDWGGGGEG